MMPHPPAAALHVAEATVYYPDGVVVRDQLVTFSWRSDDPAAVTMTLGGVPWLFARSLLVLAVDSPVPGPFGVGDVLVGRDNACTRITLRGNDLDTGPIADVLVAESDVMDFLDVAARLCPSGSTAESTIYFDQAADELAAILRNAR